MWVNLEIPIFQIAHSYSSLGSQSVICLHQLVDCIIYSVSILMQQLMILSSPKFPVKQVNFVAQGLIHEKILRHHYFDFKFIRSNGYMDSKYFLWDLANLFENYLVICLSQYVSWFLSIIFALGISFPCVSACFIALRNLIFYYC